MAGANSGGLVEGRRRLVLRQPVDGLFCMYRCSLWNQSKPEGAQDHRVCFPAGTGPRQEGHLHEAMLMKPPCHKQFDSIRVIVLIAKTQILQLAPSKLGEVIETTLHGYVVTKYSF